MTDQTFQGFGTPEQNWSKLPHSLIAALPTIKSASELKVILYILRHTWGFHETEKRISLDEFSNGRKKRGGERLDGGTGMSIPAIRNGIKRAIAHGFISVETDDSDKARVKKYYSLNQGERKLQSDCKKVTPRVKESYNRTKKETVERNQERHVATATPAQADAISTHEQSRCIACGFYSVVTFGLCHNDCWDDWNINEVLRGKCHQCGNIPGTDENCSRCQVTIKAIGLGMVIAPADATDEPCTCGNDGLCGNCGKPTATTADMPDVHNTCICKKEAALDAEFGPRPQREPQEPVEDWTVQAAQAWAQWGAESDEFQRGLHQYREAGRSVQLLGYEWEKLTQLAPDWTNKSEVKSWSSGLWACLKAAGGDASIVLDATRGAIQEGLTIANPYSVLKMTQALVGERKRGKPKPKVTPMLDQRGLDKPNPLARR